MKRVKQPAPEPTLKMLDVLHPEINQWVVMGLDPSLSRTGYAFMLVTKTVDGTSAKWLSVGSLKPDDASTPVWIRSKAIALSLRTMLRDTLDTIKSHPDAPGPYNTGLIISLEAPTPTNDFLTSINRIIHLVLLDEGAKLHRYRKVPG